MMITDNYTRWLAGEITDQQALAGLLSELRETESEIAPLEQERAALRDAISEIVVRTGAQEIDGTKIIITAPSVTASYDRKLLDALLIDLMQTDPDVAQRIALCRRESARAGSLRIESKR